MTVGLLGPTFIFLSQHMPADLSAIVWLIALKAMGFLVGTLVSAYLYVWSVLFHRLEISTHSDSSLLRTRTKVQRVLRTRPSVFSHQFCHLLISFPHRSGHILPRCLHSRHRPLHLSQRYGRTIEGHVDSSFALGIDTLYNRLWTRPSLASVRWLHLLVAVGAILSILMLRPSDLVSPNEPRQQQQRLEF